MDEAISALIEFLKSASPIVWESLVKQVYVEAWAKLGWGILSMVACIVLVVFCIRLCKEEQAREYGDELDGVWIILIVLAIIAFLASAFLLGKFVMQLSNPEYYAIKYIMDLVVVP